jgi:hypothetical protein
MNSVCFVILSEAKDLNRSEPAAEHLSYCSTTDY